VHFEAVKNKKKNIGLRSDELSLKKNKFHATKPSTPSVGLYAPAAGVLSEMVAFVNFKPDLTIT